MRVTTAHKLLLFATVAGSVGFVEFDTAGLAHDYGLMNPQSVTRIVVYMIIGFCYVILRLNTSDASTALNIERRVQGYGSSLNGIRLLLFLYALFALSIVSVASRIEALLLLYRIGEWGLVILLCSNAFPLPFRRGNTTEDEVVSFLKVLITIPVALVIAGAVFVPSIAYDYYPDIQVFRLGGYIQHPNTLSVLSGIGAVLFWSTASTRLEKLWAIVLFVVMLLTYSRGGMMGFLVSVAYVGVLFGSVSQRLSAALFALILVVVALFIDFSTVEKLFLEMALRGGELENLHTLNSRTDVWAAAIEAIRESPFFGSGFNVGPKNLGDIVGHGWWSAPHAHNDFLNAGVSGGIFASAVTLGLYLRVIYRLIAADISRRNRVALNAVMMQIVVFATLSPLLSGIVFPLAIILLILIRCTANSPRLAQQVTQKSVSF